MASQNFVTRPGSQFVQSGTGVVERTVTDKLKDVVSVKDFGAIGDGVTDDSSSIQAALDYVGGTVGGQVFFGSGTYVVNSPISLTTTKNIVLDGAAAIIKAGSAFSFGGAYYDTPFITLKGQDPVTLSISNLFRNYALLSSAVTAKKGDRLHFYDSGTTWGGPGRDYVPSVTVYVDYCDTSNSRINWLPELDLEIPALVPATPSELDKTGIVARLYNNDCFVYIGSGISFVGGVNSLAQDGGGSYQDGLLLKNGRFIVKSDFYGLASAIRAEGVELVYEGNILGSFEYSQGNALKVDGPSILKVSDSRITQCRHAIALGGGTPYEVSAQVVNCEIGASRKSLDETTYPGNDLGALDLHGNCKKVLVSNSKIYAGIQQASGELYIDNCVIRAANKSPLLFFVDGTSGPNEGSMAISNSTVLLEAFFKSSDSSPPAGSGATDSIEYYSAYSSSTGGIKWSFKAENTFFGVNDKTSWRAATSLGFDPGQHSFSSVVFSNCTFDYKDTGVRQINFAANAPGGELIFSNNKFLGCGAFIGSPKSGSHGKTYKSLKFTNNTIINEDGTVNWFASNALFLDGDTAANTVEIVYISGNNIDTYGTTAGIHMNNFPSEGVICTENTVRFTAASGTLGYAVRTSRNQTVSGTSLNFFARVANNTVLNVSGVNTITTGIQINGLNGYGGGAFPSGYYYTGSNTVLSAGTAIATTGAPVVGV